MPPSATGKKQPIDIVIPDYCNTGVIFRIMFAVNAAILPVSMVHANSWIAGLLNFVEASLLIEWSVLASIFVLCCLRRWLQKSGLINSMSRWSQRALCIVMPAMLTGIVYHFLSGYDWFRLGFSYLSFYESVLLAVLFGVVLQHYFELRARAFSPALAEARLQALQARIRPHFLFNSLNAVLSLIRKEPLRAETALEDLAELFRVSMRDARNMTTLEEEIRLCKQYLSLETIRLGERLQVEWDMAGITEEDIASTQIAALMLQPLIENAVNYGVEPTPAPSLIKVKISRSMDRIDIVVTNPVAEVPNQAMLAPKGNQIALGNIRERLALLYDVEAELATRAEPGQFEVRLRFPYVRVSA